MNQVKRLVVIHSPTSTRARHYPVIRTQLTTMAMMRGWDFVELPLQDTPYFQAAKLVSKGLHNHDLVVAAGGDGVAQVCFQAVYGSRSDAIFATVPLGNGNDISRAFNCNHHSVETILRQPVRDFYPLNVVINQRRCLTIASYITFGATTVLVDYLNKDSTRRLRRAFRTLTPAASIPLSEFHNISNSINTLDFPDFRRDGRAMTDDSIGFFLIPAAHNLLRPPKDLRLASSEFFFHHAVTKDKNVAQKVIMAGTWAVKLPGEITELEELAFGDDTNNIIANISGDNVNLGTVKTISALRSARPVKVLFNR